MIAMFKTLKLLTLAASLIFTGMMTAQAVSLSEKSILENHALWNDYRKRFIKEDGRVIDTLNNDISHSEGQGFAMVLAVAANDRESFDKLYGFAKEKLAIRSDALFAWRFDPANTPPVKDLNNASDGDLLIAWALLEASARGWGEAHAEHAGAILNDLKSLVASHQVFGRILKPGKVGFENEQGITINPSYWVFPALERISKLSGGSYWKRLISSGEQIILQHLDTGNKASPDWVFIKPDESNLYFTEEKLPLFGYEAIRVPLYLLMGKTTDKELAYKIIDSARSPEDASVLKRFNTQTQEGDGAFDELGYRTITAIADCIKNETALPAEFTQTLDQNYYPATLQLLSLLALNERSEKC